MDLYRRLQNNKVEYKLTILILSLPNRFDGLRILLGHLQRLCVNKPVQILYLGDNKSMSVGEKRNMALSMASGRYITFIDDDDSIDKDYVNDILEAIELNPEVITFRVQKYRNQVLDKEQRFTNATSRVYLSPDRTHYKMPPNHLCVWRKDVIKESFPDKSLSEDHIWAEKQLKHYSKVHHIDKILYYYYWDSSRSETHPR